MKTWRHIAAPIIAQVLDDTMGQSEPDIKQALYDAYPFGERKYFPYKVWLDEIKRQRKTQRRGQQEVSIPLFE